MAEKKAFQAESKRLLDLMIHSIYTHKEIFLRELISNASDAIDKYYLYALEHGTTPENLKIRIDLDRENRTLTISDTGIGLDEKEMEENLGIIANSGSLAFREKLEQSQSKKEEIDLIGQFGVGFYSAFMVSDKVEVLSRRVDSDQAYLWTSEGEDGYIIEPAERKEHGTTITLYLKADDDLESYSQYLDSNEIVSLVKRYSDYIRYPIELDREVQQMVEGTEKDEVPQFESVLKPETINSMIPIWKRAKNEIQDEEFEEFYHEHFYDFAKPVKTIFFSVEGNVSFTALLFIPGAVPRNFYTREYQPGLELYSKGVFIEGNCEALLPDYLRFVKGLVDSQDLSLNISREMLQHDHQLRIIRNRIEKKVLSELELMLKNDREKYEEFWKNFGLDIKLGVYNDFGINADKLKNLLLFYSSSTKSLATLKTIIEKMPDDQQKIYYVSGTDIASLSKLPIVKSLVDKGFEVLYLTEDVDEFVLQTLHSYEEHEFANVLSSDLDLSSEEEKKELQQQSEENKDLLEYMKEALPEVAEVRLSNHFSQDAAMLVAGSGLSFEMERVLETMNAQSATMPTPKAERILEINPENPIWNILKANFSTDKEKVKELAEILYAQACLIEGFKLSDPVEYSRKIITLLSQSEVNDK